MKSLEHCKKGSVLFIPKTIEENDLCLSYMLGGKFLGARVCVCLCISYLSFITDK